jgi:hypothetical protein
MGRTTTPDADRPTQKPPPTMTNTHTLSPSQQKSGTSNAEAFRITLAFITTMRPDGDAVSRALRAYLLSGGGGGDSNSVIVETPPSSCSNAVVRVLRIPWCEGHLEWKVRSGFVLRT